MAPFAALASILAAAAFPAAVGPVAVGVVSDISECPSSREVQSALRRALGEEGEQAAGGWTLWYDRDPAAPVAEREASLLMELAAPSSESQMASFTPSRGRNEG
jgi:hypothetical protein